MGIYSIKKILERNAIVPVATIANLDDIETLVEKLEERGITCIEVTLRTEVSLKAIEILKKRYSNKLEIGVGTLVSYDQLRKVVDVGVDFIVSPGMPLHLQDQLVKADIPFIPGVVTPSDVITGLSLGYDTFKLFPAETVGGVELLNTYNSVFPEVKFCPTGGISEKNYQNYLALENVISVGGSWVLK